MNPYINEKSSAFSAAPGLQVRIAELFLRRCLTRSAAQVETEGKKGFYRFDEKRWGRTMDVFYKMEEADILITAEHSTIRRLIQKRIASFYDRHFKGCLKMV